MIKKRGFTISEILIAFVILAVIACMIVPGMYNDSRDAEYHSALKSTMSDLTSATALLSATKGKIKVGNGEDPASDSAFRDDFCTVLDCVKQDTQKNVFKSVVYKYYEGAGWDTYNSTDNVSAILSNGTFLDFESYATCTNGGTKINGCGTISVDINGGKKPNMLGKDMYRFYVARNDKEYSVIPWGTDMETYAPAYNTCKVGNGRGCAYWRLYFPDRMP